jgi:amino-acid N-acetyltransferase
MVDKREKMRHRRAQSADFDEIKALLIACNLPSDDIAEHFDTFVVYEEEGMIIGVGGLEKHGTDGLVRSMAVRSHRQSKGIGQSIYQSIENSARLSGIDTLYLLTESAVEYFSKLGFIVKARSEIPESIMSTKQFKFLCPLSATIMVRELTD